MNYTSHITLTSPPLRFWQMGYYMSWNKTWKYLELLLSTQTSFQAFIKKKKKNPCLFTLTISAKANASIW